MNMDTSKVLRLSHRTTFDTLWNEVPHLSPAARSETRLRNGNSQKWALLQQSLEARPQPPHPGRAANGCRRQSSVKRTRLQDPKSKIITLRYPFGKVNQNPKHSLFQFGEKRGDPEWRWAKKIWRQRKTQDSQNMFNIESKLHVKTTVFPLTLTCIIQSCQSSHLKFFKVSIQDKIH